MPNAHLTCVLGGAVVAEGKNRDAQISQVEMHVLPATASMSTSARTPRSTTSQISDTSLHTKQLFENSCVVVLEKSK